MQSYKEAQPTTAAVTSKFDDAVREAWKSGKSSRVIMRFATIADRDQAFGELLNDGAAVRIMDGETPSLNVVAAATLANIQSAEGVSYDAPVTVLAFKESS